MLTLRDPRNHCDFGEGTDFERRALEAFAASLSQHRRNARTRSPSWCSRIIVCKHWSRSYYFGKLRLRSAIAHLLDVLGIPSSRVISTMVRRKPMLTKSRCAAWFLSAADRTTRGTPRVFRYVR